MILRCRLYDVIFTYNTLKLVPIIAGIAASGMHLISLSKQLNNTIEQDANAPIHMAKRLCLLNHQSINRTPTHTHTYTHTHTHTHTHTLSHTQGTHWATILQTWYDQYPRLCFNGHAMAGHSLHAVPPAQGGYNRTGGATGN